MPGVVHVKIKYISPKVQVRYHSALAAGADLQYSGDAPLIIQSGQVVIVPTGVKLAIPRGYEGQVRMRSSTALTGLTLANGVGTIDADYRGEVKLLLHNFSNQNIVITPYERIAQLIVHSIPEVLWHETEELPATTRGENGLGSTER